MARKHISLTILTTLITLLTAGGAIAAANKMPVVTAFDVADNSASPIPVLTFAATDFDGTVSGYLITESSTKPSASAPGWSSVKPTQYTTSSSGAIRLYPWV